MASPRLDLRLDPLGEIGEPGEPGVAAPLDSRRGDVPLQAGELVDDVEDVAELVRQAGGDSAEVEHALARRGPFGLTLRHQRPPQPEAADHAASSSVSRSTGFCRQAAAPRRSPSSMSSAEPWPVIRMTLVSG